MLQQIEKRAEWGGRQKSTRPGMSAAVMSAYSARFARLNMLWSLAISSALVLGCLVASVVSAGMGRSLPGCVFAGMAMHAAVAAACVVSLATGIGAGRGRRVAALALALSSNAAMAYLALSLCGYAPPEVVPSALTLCAVAMNMAMLPTARASVYVASVALANAAFAAFAATVPLSRAATVSIVSVAFVAVAGTAAAAALCRTRARAFAQGANLAKKHALLSDAVRKLVWTNERLESISTTDELTQLSNRRSFTARLESYWGLSIRTGSMIALLMVDIDDFKKYNDNYGHLEGDKCLQSVASCLAGAVSRDMDFVARIGGEEFMVIACGVNEDGVRLIAERLRSVVAAARIEHRKSTVSDRVTVSIGCALTVPQPGSSANDLIKKADIALYESKRLGRNRSTIYRQPKDARFDEQ